MNDYSLAGLLSRLAIARIFLRNLPILILDEAISALDTFADVLRLNQSELVGQEASHGRDRSSASANLDKRRGRGAALTGSASEIRRGIGRNDEPDAGRVTPPTGLTNELERKVPIPPVGKSAPTAIRRRPKSGPAPTTTRPFRSRRRGLVPCRFAYRRASASASR